MKIETVLGPIGADELGMALMHEHIAIDRYAVTGDYNKRLRDEELIVLELQQFERNGGNTIVELTPPSLGRDPELLARVSKATGLNIVMGSGWYTEAYEADRITRSSTQNLAEQLVQEIRYGVANTGIKPGIIGEVATGEYISPVEERTFRAASRACNETGLPLTTHAFGSQVAIQQIELLNEEKVDPARVVIGHQDSVPDPDFHEWLFQQGVWVQFDLIRAENDWEIQRRAELISQVIRRGYGHRLLLSHDVCMKSHLKAYGGQGFTAITDHIFPALINRGHSAAECFALVQDNPRHLFQA